MDRNQQRKCGEEQCAAVFDIGQSHDPGSAQSTAICKVYRGRKAHGSALQRQHETYFHPANKLRIQRKNARELTVR